MPKKAASKSVASCRNPPLNPAAVQPRSVGAGPITSKPAVTNRHRSSGERTPPGKRQPVATMAIGSSAATVVVAAVAVVAADQVPGSAAARWSASAAGVG